MLGFHVKTLPFNSSGDHRMSAVQGSDDELASEIHICKHRLINKPQTTPTKIAWLHSLLRTPSQGATLFVIPLFFSLYYMQQQESCRNKGSAV